MGGKSEIRVSLEDEPGAVSGSKWPQAETHQHAAGQGAVAAVPLSNQIVAHFQTPPIKFFRSGNSKGPEDHRRLHLPRLVGYQMIMLTHLGNRSNYSASTDTGYCQFSLCLLTVYWSEDDVYTNSLSSTNQANGG